MRLLIPVFIYFFFKFYFFKAVSLEIETPTGCLPYVPDRGSNAQHFGLQDDTPSTQPRGQGCLCTSWSKRGLSGFAFSNRAGVGIPLGIRII